MEVSSVVRFLLAKFRRAKRVGPDLPKEKPYSHPQTGSEAVPIAVGRPHLTLVTPPAASAAKTAVVQYSSRDEILQIMQMGRFQVADGNEFLLTIEEKPFPPPIDFVRNVVANIGIQYLQGIYQMLAQNPAAEHCLIRKILGCPFQQQGATLFLLEEDQYISFHLVSLDKKQALDLEFTLKQSNFFIDTETGVVLADVAQNARLYGGEWGGSEYWEN